MNRNQPFVSWVLGVSLVVAVCSWATAAENTSAKLTILHTSDLHGSVLPFNDYANRPSNRGSLAQVATLVDEIRSTTDHPVMVLDSGDTLQGTPLEQFAHVRWGEPSPTIDAMNRIGYQAMAVGNHEFNFGLEVLERARKQADFPFLSANILREGTEETAFRALRGLRSGPDPGRCPRSDHPQRARMGEGGKLQRTHFRTDGRGRPALGPDLARKRKM